MRQAVFLIDGTGRLYYLVVRIQVLQPLISWFFLSVPVVNGPFYFWPDSSVCVCIAAPVPGAPAYCKRCGDGSQ
jgi:hypothetical protein